MTVEEVRANYQFWAQGGMRHIATCRFTDHPFHDHIWKRIEANSIALDLAVSEAHPAEPPLTAIP